MVKFTISKELWNQYCNLFCKGFSADEKKTQENRLKHLLSTLNKPDGVYKYFPFTSLKTEEQAKVLNYLLNGTNERQVVSNMGKSDVDRDYFNFIYEKSRDEDCSGFIMQGFSEYTPYDLRKEVCKNRRIIRDHSILVDEALSELQNVNERIIRSLLHEQELFYILGLCMECYSYLEDYIDYVADGVLQLINYRVFALDNPICSKQVLQNMVSEVLALTSLVDIQLERRWANNQKKQNLTPEIITRFFAFYRHHYSKFYEELAILEVLRQEVTQNKTLFCPLKKTYTTEKLPVPEEKISQLQEIITEGQHSYDFKTKLDLVRTFIGIMGVYGGRDCFPNSPQDIKVYYREIFMSKATYKGKQAASIVKDYLKQVQSSGTYVPFSRNSHYMFVREKISRGYFREKGSLDLYFLKADFEKALYDLLLKLYLFYDYKDTLEFIYEINYHLLVRLQTELSAG